MAKKRSSPGQPTKYKEEYCEMLVNHMAQGYSFESFGADINVSFRTLYNWADNYPQFLQAKELGLTKCRKFWEKLGIAGTAGQIPGFQSGTWMFNMKNRFGFQDIHRIDSRHVDVQIRADLNDQHFKHIRDSIGSIVDDIEPELIEASGVKDVS